ncbi:MAG: ABC transporter substrate-binding protein [Limnochordales bacterium]|nr:ABC transporter substrate-binding protein [Limnochordales bacterium]
MALVPGLAEAKVTITLWHFLGAGLERDALTVMKEAFEKLHPDIQVSMQEVPWGDAYYSKLLVAVVGGTPPDVAMMHATRIAEFAEAGSLLELTPAELEAAGIRSDDYFPIPWEASKYKGKLYALPFDIHPIGLYFNPTLFDYAGLSPKAPETGEQVFQYSRKLIRDTNGDGKVDQYGFGIRRDSFTYYRLWYSVLKQLGGAFFAADEYKMSTDTAQVKALNILVDSVKTGTLILDPAADRLFAESSLAMFIDGTWTSGGFVKSGVDFEAAPLPVFGTKPAAWTDSHLLVLPKPARVSKERLEAAKTFVKWMTQNSYTWCQMAGHVSPSLKVVASPEFRALKHQVQFARMLPYVVYFPQVPRAWDMQIVVADGLASAFELRETPESALAAIRTRINALISASSK